MIINAQTICERALRLIGVLDPGESADPDDLRDAYQSLQEMMDGWKADRLAIPVVERAEYPLTAGQSTYTIGTGGDFSRDRPETIDLAYYRYSNGGTPLIQSIELLTVERYSDILMPTLQDKFPRVAYYETTWPLGQIHLYPVPTQANLDIILLIPTALDEFAAITTLYHFPPAYARGIRYCLAQDLIPDFAVPVELASMITARAQEFLGDIRLANIKPVEVTVDQALLGWALGTYDIRSDGIR